MKGGGRGFHREEEETLSGETYLNSYRTFFPMNKFTFRLPSIQNCDFAIVIAYCNRVVNFSPSADRLLTFLRALPQIIARVTSRLDHRQVNYLNETAFGVNPADLAEIVRISFALRLILLKINNREDSVLNLDILVPITFENLELNKE